MPAVSEKWGAKSEVGKDRDGRRQGERREGEGVVEIGDCCSFKERDPTCVD